MSKSSTKPRKRKKAPALAVSRRMSPYMARKLRGEFHGSPLFQFGVGDDGHTVVAERGERAALQRRLPVVADDYQPGILRLGSFFVSSSRT